MKVITVCLLVLVSASCLLTTHANAVGPSENFGYDFEIEQLLSGLDGDFDYMGVAEQGFIHSCRSILIKALKGIRGTNCILKETLAVLTACTTYVDAIDGCGVAVTKDVARIVDTVKSMITICDNIIHLHSKLCATEDTTTNGTGKTSGKCFRKVLDSTMLLVIKMNVALDLIANLPADTSSCFVGATNTVKDACNAFLPNIDVCIASM
ncbi:uncharacterized protein LOC117899946 [Drosophila subobscura]|uniref:uncharacterized protein LOC117899946 n=1 Tax=Drosophila subobscura TaxID=7241 RepID=UPI00155A2DCD|nr:uncharacterized protein LOC117899946 [Drosophila subobscura]